MIPTLNNDGFLPPGRWGATLDEVRSCFAQDSSSRRAEVWAEFEAALSLLRSVVRVSRVWVGGSFISVKEEPGDVDAVFFVRADQILHAQLREDDSRILELAASGHRFKEVTGLRVDSFLVPWPLEAGADVTGYQQLRGSWDDWWERRRRQPGEPVESEAYQRRGYVEVIIDGNR